MIKEALGENVTAVQFEVMATPEGKAEALKHFFAAMREGYATDEPQQTTEALPGSKTIEYQEGPWRVVDRYFVTPFSAYSGGQTVLWYGTIPVWIMHYLGFYKDEAIPCLKVALQENYAREIFRGGRGPAYFKHQELRYFNSAEESDFFGSTLGSEKILGPDDTILGWHRYQALWMV